MSEQSSPQTPASEDVFLEYRLTSMLLALVAAMNGGQRQSIYEPTLEKSQSSRRTLNALANILVRDVEIIAVTAIAEHSPSDDPPEANTLEVFAIQEDDDPAQKNHESAQEGDDSTQEGDDSAQEGDDSTQEGDDPMQDVGKPTSPRVVTMVPTTQWSDSSKACSERFSEGSWFRNIERGQSKWAEIQKDPWSFSAKS
jgi:hypothetical protein